MMLPWRLADRLILRPTAHPIEAPGKQRRLIGDERLAAEVWIERTPAAASDDDIRVFILKFPGTAGRAERATLHPAEAWPQWPSEVWAVNPPGYGDCPGSATLRVLAPVAQLVWDELTRVAAGRPILVAGNSLGTAAALYLGARVPVAGLLLRNPPPLRQLIVRRHGWWNLWLPAWGVARLIPRELDSIHNARQCRAPAVAVASQNDELVPRAFQSMILAAYAGPLHTFVIPAVGHADPIPEQYLPEYYDRLRWLGESLGRSLGPSDSHI